MQLHDTVLVNCKKDATTDIKGQVPTIYGLKGEYSMIVP